MHLDRVILATDAKPFYQDFLPLVARAWRDKLSVNTAVAFIGNHPPAVAERGIEIVPIAPVAGLDAGFQAQVVRLLLPVLYPQDVCLLADIDMLPLRRRYFTQSVRHVADDAFVVYRDGAYDPGSGRYPVCYNAGRGSTFREVFDARSVEDLRALMARWAAMRLGWNTDEMILYQTLHQWPAFAARCVRLGHHVQRRIDRAWWKYSGIGVWFGRYIDAHLPRPYSDHRAVIDALASQAGLLRNSRPRPSCTCSSS